MKFALHNKPTELIKTEPEPRDSRDFHICESCDRLIWTDKSYYILKGPLWNRYFHIGCLPDNKLTRRLK